MKECRRKWAQRLGSFHITNILWVEGRFFVDVTASIPAFDVEIDGLSDVAAEFRSRQFTDILDFGAGKLRNAFYLIRKGFKVWAMQ